MPRTCLLVIAHPLDQSLCRRFAETARQAAEGAGMQVTVADLYKRGFDPALSAVERAAYVTDTPDTARVSTEIAELQAAEVLILVFPTWWFGFPAILKGWFDRVWLPGIAFSTDTAGGPIRPRLDRLRQVVAITTLGSPWWVDRLILRQPLRRILTRAIVGPCAKDARVTFLSLYGAEVVEESRAARFEAKVRKAVTRSA